MRRWGEHATGVDYKLFFKVHDVKKNCVLEGAALILYLKA